MKIFKKLYGLVGTLGIIGIFAVNAYPMLMGGKLYQIETGSMEPTIKTGSYVLIRPTEEIKTGQVVMFDQPGYPVPIVHRIVAINAGGKTLTTRGDANGAEDASIDRSQVHGIVTDVFSQYGVYHRPYQIAAGIFSLCLVGLSLTKSSKKGRHKKNA
ncbi:MAG: signal peptidase I [Varibaculum cambriense]|uniref:signal peptidase I n=1 Tax=Varibaculum cambriense TaxID=184870 RepID=UPI00290E37DC|nr:signal peptidase I [Varibaculum cambriense]MDU4944286.1 signal peptidase I [Varibaculum cambriense]